MTMRRLAAVLATAAVTAGVLAGCSGENWTDKCATTDGVVECAPGQRTAVKPVSGELLDGGSYDLSQDKGKVVVVNFWGSWCAPCRAEADDLESTFQATKDKNVTFLGVNSRDDKDAAREFERGRVTYPSLYDFEGKLGLQFDVTNTAMPSTLIIDRQGRIAVAIRKATTATQLRPLVERVAAEGNG
ncbi:TlpA disulfide reductase family protein [Paractinoplanes lichenicola]|uniref:TlpA family protein disulfide reductase n=1 Tax=Paractinoplanes lichenicola TaxID=2802976 RepID=A0ABS1W2B1_9ACTN|nr:TlpA disulfide reductase family protein [Actinoplanes lichenicola]MBL7260884.1 TlpA family protein disulfide reductase [Actinoplanes lichenicola]